MSELWGGVGLAWAGILAACTALNALASLLLARASLPRRLEARLERVRTELDGMGKALEDYARQHANNEAVIRGLVEEAEAAFERAERKRSSAAATASRLERRQQTEEVPQTRAELISLMRRRGA